MAKKLNAGLGPIHSNESETLRRAIDHLGAIEVAPGRYAYRVERCAHGFDDSHRSCPTAGDQCEGTLGRWNVFGAVVYSNRLCTSFKDLVEMPAWWSPTRRFAVGVSTKLAFATLEEARAAFDAPHDVFTASLETGEEVPA